VAVRADDVERQPQAGVRRLQADAAKRLAGSARSSDR
jgi:hypothetical protein